MNTPIIPSTSPKKAIAALTVLFGVAIVAPRLWFYVLPAQRPEYIRISVRHDMPNMKFLPEPVAEYAVAKLATTNLFNGSFTNREDKVTVFFADWLPNQSRDMSAVLHTPDICWVSAGWKVVKVPLPGTVMLRVGDIQLPFECRTFEAPTGHREFTMWCALVGGQVSAEGERFGEEDDVSETAFTRAANATRRVAANRFLSSLRSRIPGNGSKQFVRLSKALSPDPTRTLSELVSFAEAWVNSEVVSVSGK